MHHFVNFNTHTNKLLCSGNLVTLVTLKEMFIEGQNIRLSLKNHCRREAKQLRAMIKNVWEDWWFPGDKINRFELTKTS